MEELGREFLQLQLHAERCEPKLAECLQETKRLRLELDRVRRECQLCQRALDQHLKERKKYEDQLEDYRKHIRKLEDRVNAITQGSKAWQQKRRFETEYEDLKAERENVASEVSQIEATNNEQQRQHRMLSAIVAQRAIDLGVTNPNGGADGGLLWDLGAAQETVHLLEGNLSVANEEVQRLTKENEHLATMWDSVCVQRQHGTTMVKTLEDDVKRAREQRDALTAEVRQLRSDGNLAREEVSALQVTLNGGGRKRVEGQRQRQKLQDDLATMKESKEKAAASHLERVSELERLSVELRGHLEEARLACVEEWQSRVRQQSQLSDLRLRRQAAENRLVAAEASEQRLAKLVEDFTQGSSEQLTKIDAARQRKAVCEREASAALDRMTVLNSQATEQEKSKAKLQHHIDCLIEERETAAVQAEAAEQRAGQALHESELSLKVLSDREADLEQLRQERILLQQQLASEVTGACSDLGLEKDSKASALRELLALQRENTRTPDG